MEAADAEIEQVGRAGSPGASFGANTDGRQENEDDGPEGEDPAASTPSTSPATRKRKEEQEESAGDDCSTIPKQSAGLTNRGQGGDPEAPKDEIMQHEVPENAGGDGAHGEAPMDAAEKTGAKTTPAAKNTRASRAKQASGNKRKARDLEGAHGNTEVDPEAPKDQIKDPTTSAKDAEKKHEQDSEPIQDPKMDAAEKTGAKTTPAAKNTRASRAKQASGNKRKARDLEGKKQDQDSDDESCEEVETPALDGKMKTGGQTKAQDIHGGSSGKMKTGGQTKAKETAQDIDGGSSGKMKTGGQTKAQDIHGGSSGKMKTGGQTKAQDSDSGSIGKMKIRGQRARTRAPVTRQVPSPSKRRRLVLESSDDDSSDSGDSSGSDGVGDANPQESGEKDGSDDDSGDSDTTDEDANSKLGDDGGVNDTRKASEVDDDTTDEDGSSTTQDDDQDAMETIEAPVLEDLPRNVQVNCTPKEGRFCKLQFLLAYKGKVSKESVAEMLKLKVGHTLKLRLHNYEEEDVTVCLVTRKNSSDIKNHNRLRVDGRNALVCTASAKEWTALNKVLDDPELDDTVVRRDLWREAYAIAVTVDSFDDSINKAFNDPDLVSYMLDRKVRYKLEDAVEAGRRRREAEAAGN